jgi:hypothetical protein
MVSVPGSISGTAPKSVQRAIFFQLLGTARIVSRGKQKSERAVTLIFMTKISIGKTRGSNRKPDMLLHTSLFYVIVGYQAKDLF